jgi:hypothetical protein
MNDKPLNAYQKLALLKESTKGFYKDGSTSDSTKAIKYVTGSQVLAKINPVMKELGLIFVLKEVNHRSFEPITISYRSGDKLNFIVQASVVYEWVNTEDPEDKIVIRTELYGQQDEASKAFGSGLTYTERYTLLKSLGLPTDEEDPDARGSGEEVKKDGFKKTPVTTTSNGHSTKSNYATINELIKGSKYTLEHVNKSIEKTYGKSLKINELTEDQFADVYTKLQDAINRDQASA